MGTANSLLPRDPGPCLVDLQLPPISPRLPPLLFASGGPIGRVTFRDWMICVVIGAPGWAFFAPNCVRFI
jgi:hypothetical protein